MSRGLQIFIGSKMQKRAPERAAVKAALAELHADVFVSETDAGARPGSIRGTYPMELDASDLYMGIFWKGYGEYTVEEFEHARARGKDCLVYEKREEPSLGGREPALRGFLDRIGEVESGLTIRRFPGRARTCRTGP
jgi:hypothetical protein